MAKRSVRKRRRLEQLGEPVPTKCEGLHPKSESRCKEDAITTRMVDGIEYALCRVHADGVDLMERRRKLAAQ